MWRERSGLSGPLPIHRSQSSFAIGDFDAIGPLSRADFPHRHTFYEIVHVLRGTGEHVVDLVSYPLRPPHLHVVYPGQVHFWHRAADVEGHVILFADDFLSAFPGDRAMLRSLSGQTLCAAGLEVVIAEMQSEYEVAAPGFTSVLQCYLHILLLRASRRSAPSPQPALTSRAASLTTQFSQLLSALDGHRLTVRQCAQQLGVSQAYLNEVVRTVTGFTPAQVMRRVQMLEAQRLLSRTELSVTQVAREVGFADPAYFCRFFRREAGVSPGAFRNHHHYPIDSIDHRH